MIEPGIKPAQTGEDDCAARSPGGWYCCLVLGHDGPHIGSTENWGSLYLWPQEAES